MKEVESNVIWVYLYNDKIEIYSNDDAIKFETKFNLFAQARIFYRIEFYIAFNN